MTVRKTPADQLPSSPTATGTPGPETAEPPLWLSRLELPLQPAAVHEARAHAGHTLGCWAVEPSIIEDALLIVSELATNSVQHCKPSESGGRFVLTLCHLPTTLQIYVADEDPRPPIMREPTGDGAGGRGLYLVSVVSDFWACHFPAPGVGTGKAVLAELRLAGPMSGDAQAVWNVSAMPPMSDTSPLTRASILSSLQDVLRGGPFVFARA